MTFHQIDLAAGTEHSKRIIETMIEVGVLVPVEPCEHGNIYPHDVSTLHSTTQNGVPLWYVDTCLGANIGEDSTP